MLKKIKFLLNQPDSFKIVGYYPYTSFVSMRLLEQNHNYKTEEHDFLNEIGMCVRDKIESLDLRWDNKVVIELEHINTLNCYFKESNIFIGWCDGNWSLGLGVWQPDSYTKNLNINFK